jgi:hypothetical protein
MVLRFPRIPTRRLGVKTANRFCLPDGRSRLRLPAFTHFSS